MVRQAHHDNCIPLLNNKSNKNRKFLPPVTQQIEADEMILSGCLSRLMRGVVPPKQIYRGVDQILAGRIEADEYEGRPSKLLQLKPHLFHFIRAAADK